ncbi:MAG: alpha/beta fold hydrolase [Acidimicrobiales bacterium]
MKRLTVDGLSLAYEEAGSGAETVVMSHSYLVDHRQFADQIGALKQRYRVLAYDHRGHGQSDRPAESYNMDAIYRDAEAFIEATSAAPCHFVGLSTGGFVGLRLALRRPELLASLVLMDTSAEAESLVKRVKYEAMFAVLRTAGFGPVTNTTMSIMFGPDFLNDPKRSEEVAVWRDRMTANDVKSLVRFGRAIFGRDSLVDQLEQIEVPTLVMVGEHDDPQPVPRSTVIADAVPGAQLYVIPKAGHLSTIESPIAVNAALTSFLGTGSLPPEES